MASLSLASLVLPSGEALSAAPLVAPPPAAAPPPPPVAPSYGTLPSYNPPLFFEIVEDQVYRSNKCDASSFPFLATLQLNTVVYLSYDDLTRELVDFFKEKDINVVRMRDGLLSCWLSCICIKWLHCLLACLVRLDSLGVEVSELFVEGHLRGHGEGSDRAHPRPAPPPDHGDVQVRVDCTRMLLLLLLCGSLVDYLESLIRTGVHFAGTIIGCLRRLQNWSLTATIDKVCIVSQCA